MQRQFLALAAFAVLMANGASADDRPVTDDESAKLTAAVTAQGCSGGEMEFDDNHFELDDARCDGREYDLRFDTSFKLIEKKLDD
jgi:Peptidase propeptide and YPEB domain